MKTSNLSPIFNQDSSTARNRAGSCNCFILTHVTGNLAIGNFAAFEEFTAFDDSDYDSSDFEDEPPSDGPPSDSGPQSVKQPPKSDKNHEVKPKEKFLKLFSSIWK